MIGSISSFRSRLPFAFFYRKFVLRLGDQFLTCFFGGPLGRHTRSLARMDKHFDVIIIGRSTISSKRVPSVRRVKPVKSDYATVADVGTFLANNQERHPTDIAKLHGAHLVVAQETAKGRRWDEAKIKTMTGGDVMTGRFMRCDYFDFVPKFKLFITECSRGYSAGCSCG
jgi:hypothetical protein